MQANLKRIAFKGKEFSIEPANFSVKKFSFRDAFTVTHRSAVTYDIFHIPHISSIETRIEPVWPAGNFFSAKTLDQLIAEQGTLPVYDLSVFAGAIPDEDMDEFVSDIYRTRTVQ